MDEENELRDLELQDLFNEIIRLEQGDLWEGMMSASRRRESDLAKKVFGEKMIKLGINWD